MPLTLQKIFLNQLPGIPYIESSPCSEHTRELGVAVEREHAMRKCGVAAALVLSAGLASTAYAQLDKPIFYVWSSGGQP